MSGRSRPPCTTPSSLVVKLYLDDKRSPPPGWTLTRNPHTAFALVEDGVVAQLSLDHDLALWENGREVTGYDVLNWIERKVWTEPDFFPPLLRVHSANPSARRRMDLAIRSIYRAVETRGD